MERIEQKIAEHIFFIERHEFIYLEQTEGVPGDSSTDVIQIERSTIPALIAALQKYAE